MSRPFKPFEECYAPDPNSGCWIFTGCWDSYGYGKMRNNIKAHRYSFEVHKGAVPSGEFVCHKCDTPACVNPDHLFLGGAVENSQDMVKKRRHAFGGKTRISRLDESKVLEILRSSEPGFVLAKRFGVSDTAVSCVRLGRTWRHVPRPDGYKYIPYRAPGSHEKYCDIISKPERAA